MAFSAARWRGVAVRAVALVDTVAAG